MFSCLSELESSLLQEALYCHNVVYLSLVYLWNNDSFLRDKREKPVTGVEETRPEGGSSREVESGQDPLRMGDPAVYRSHKLLKSF